MLVEGKLESQSKVKLTVEGTSLSKGFMAPKNINYFKWLMFKTAEIFF